MSRPLSRRCGYCALGLPIVSTEVPEGLQAGPQVYLGRDGASFAEAVRQALAGDSAQKI